MHLVKPHLFKTPFFERRKKPPKSIIEVAEAKMRAIDILTYKLPVGSRIPMSKVEEVATKFEVAPEELARKLTVQKGYNVYRD